MERNKGKNRRISNFEFRTAEVAPLPACRALAGRLVAKNSGATSSVRNSAVLLFCGSNLQIYIII